jgi:hypothetical protein
MRVRSWRSLLESNIYSVTAALLGVVFSCWAILDWAGYTSFALSLLWL